ncbi:hypothetical protein ACET3Z_016176 [Daucus carota]
MPTKRGIRRLHFSRPRLTCLPKHLPHSLYITISSQLINQVISSNTNHPNISNLPLPTRYLTLTSPLNTHITRPSWIRLIKLSHKQRTQLRHRQGTRRKKAERRLDRRKQRREVMDSGKGVVLPCVVVASWMPVSDPYSRGLSVRSSSCIVYSHRCIVSAGFSS